MRQKLLISSASWSNPYKRHIFHADDGTGKPLCGAKARKFDRVFYGHEQPLNCRGCRKRIR